MNSAPMSAIDDETFRRRVTQSEITREKATSRATTEYENEAATERERHRLAMRKITDRWNTRLASASEEHAAEVRRATAQLEGRGHGG